ncbi:MAG TPA: SpoIIE family protein phosphatase [Steroidobacteraceae bacterium]|nr:SpoIIE family protein phosphatase [Steroidobacteraceae bacterium]
MDHSSVSSRARAAWAGLTLPAAVTPVRQVAGLVAAKVRAFARLLVEGDGPYARAFENLILALIVFSVASIGVDSIPGLPERVLQALRACEIVIVAIFTFEYLLRIVAATNGFAFIFSYQGMIDLLAVAPFYLGGFDARWLRALRLLRLLRVLKLQTHVLERVVEERTRELADKNAALEKAQAQLKAELEVARSLQLAILPAAFPARPGCQGAARMIPATTMGGDFYDFIELPDGQIGLVIADVSGHGVPAAFFMAVARTNLRELAVRHTDPGECLAQTNDTLCAQNPLDLFVTVFYCILDPRTGMLRYANGGHNPPYVRRAAGPIVSLDGAGGLVLGAMPGVRFPTHTAQLLRGDQLVLYTDGVTEAFNAAQELYGAQRLVDEVHVHGSGTPAALVERICQSVTHFAGAAPQSDDITLTVLTWGAP